MRKLLLSLLIFFSATALFAEKGYNTTYSESSSKRATVTFSINDYGVETTTLEGNLFSKITFDGSVATKERGFAELPFLSSTIQLPADKNVDINVIASEYQDITLTAPLVPSRGVIYRNQNPDEIPYSVNPASITDAWYPSDISELKEPFILRDIRGTTIMVYPFQYNAAKQILRVYTSVTVEITQNATKAVNPLTRVNEKYYREMNGIYESMFINYNASKQDLTVNEAGDILVITTERDAEAILPFVQWKREKGYEVFVETVATGTNVVDMIQTAYDNNPEILYVQLVGDWADIKVDTDGGAPIDPMAGCVVGTDVFPDICIGRFSANSPTDVVVQVEKTITYEKSPEVDATWYETALGIGSDQGASSGDDGEMDKTHIQIIYDNKLDPFTFNNYFPNYDPGASATTVGNNVDEGVAWINYCGHGSNTSWGTTGFSNTNISALSNGNMLPGIISVACVNGAYHSGTCFAEAWLSKANGGALVTLMSTINQSWQPPMRGQDYINDILTGGYDYDNNPGNGINTSESRTTFGSLIANGVILMYTESQGSDDLETLKTWVTFGDPSVQLRTAPPASLEMDNNVVLVGMPFEATITSDGDPVQNALVSLSSNDLFYSAYTNDEGFVSIENELLPGDVQLVVTAFNTQTIYETISCIPPEGPYVIFGQKVLNDANGNGQLEYGEEAAVDITMKNVGIEIASNIIVTISTTDEYATIINNEATFGDIPVGGTITIEDAFSFEAANNIPDEHGILFDLTSTDGTETWMSKFTLKGYAPVMAPGTMSINDLVGNNNGRLDAGETAEVTIYVNNTGHAVSQDIVATLATTSAFLTIDEGSANCEPVMNGEQGMLVFTVTADAATPIGTAADFIFHADCGEISLDKTFYTTMGLIMEDFETGDFTSFDWQQSGDLDWTITDAGAYEGMYSAKSGAIADGQSSSLVLEYNVMADDSISFYVKASSEASYDFIRFYIDGTKKNEWSGTVGWTRYASAVTEGLHTFEWEYIKDYMVSSGDDCAWIDYIVLPAEMRTVAYAGNDDVTCEGASYTMQANATNYQSLAWTTTGTGTFDDATMLLATYTPSDEDIIAGEVMLTIDVLGNDEENYTDDMALTFGMIPVVEAGDDGDICAGVEFAPTATAEYYESIEWTTSGDGDFNDASIINAVYTPGANDIATGTVTLSMMAYSPCGNVSDFTTLMINSGPDMPATIMGETEACGAATTTYTSEGSSNADTYAWNLKPSEAGMLSIEDLTVNVLWSADFNGDAEIKLIATNTCGETESEPVMVAVTALPLMPEMPTGIDSIDMYKVTTAVFNIDAMANTTGYTWAIDPVEAGTIENTDNECTVTFADDYMGMAYIRVCGDNNCGAGNMSTAKAVKVYNSVGINDITADLWSVYPNPAANMLTVSTPELQGEYTLNIVNTLGAEVFSTVVNQNNSNTITVDVSELSNGVYFVSLKTESNTTMKKIMINR